MRHHTSPSVTKEGRTRIHFGNWLKLQIAGSLLGQREWAEKHDIKFDTLKVWLGSSKPNIRGTNFVKLAKALTLTQDDLQAKLDAADAARLPVRNRPGERLTLHMVPLFNSVSAARWADRTNLQYPEGWAERFVGAPTSDPLAFAAVVDGDCMEPEYPNGIVVVFSPSLVDEEGVIGGRDYFIQLDGSGDEQNTFKRVLLDPEDDSVFVLRCINPKYKGSMVVERQKVIRAALAVCKMEFTGKGAAGGRAKRV